MDYRQQNPYGGWQDPGQGQGSDFEQRRDQGQYPGRSQLAQTPQYPETASATTSPDNANSGGVAYAIAAAAIVAIMLLVMLTSSQVAQYVQEVLNSGDPSLEQPFSKLYDETLGEGASDLGLDTGTIEG